MADDIVKFILEETERRKAIWAQMEEAARKAIAAVTKEAKKRGIQGMGWVGRAGQYTHVAYELNSGDRRSFILYESGKLDKSGSSTYEGYPELTKEDPQILIWAATEQLMGDLNDHIDGQQA